MRRSKPALLRLLLTGWCCLGLGACAHPYRAPLQTEPHALLKLRRIYHLDLKGSHSETVGLGSFELLSRSGTAFSGVRTDAVRVHPGLAPLVLNASFSHSEGRMVRESYTVSEPYTTTETYSCGSFQSYRTCTRSVTRYRSETRWRNVHRTVTVVDAACSATASHHFEAGKSYLLQFDFRAHGSCSVSCFQQSPDGEGFQLTPCGALPAPGSAGGESSSTGSGEAGD